MWWNNTPCLPLKSVGPFQLFEADQCLEWLRFYDWYMSEIRLAFHKLKRMLVLTACSHWGGERQSLQLLNGNVVTSCMLGKYVYRSLG